MQKIKDAKAKMQKMEHKMSNQLRKKTSPTTIALKKIDIVTSMHIDEPQWDIVLEITDMCNRDIKLAKQVLKHLLFLLQESIEISLDNQQLYNCLTVIDSLARNGNKNVLTVIHQTYLEALARLANMAETEEKQKSLLQSDKKTCRIRVLELIMSWGRDFDPNKYPNFYKTYSKLKMEGLPFNLVEKSNLVPVRAPTNISNNKDNNDNNNNQNASNIANGNINGNNHNNHNNNNNNNNNNENNEENDEKKIDPKYLSPWEQKHMEFGKWYKKKLKHDLKQLAEMCCMVQDVIAIKNAEDASFLCMELRESNRRLVGLMLRTDDPEAVSIMLQWITIIAGLLQCVQKLQSGQHVQVPGITKESLDMLIDSL